MDDELYEKGCDPRGKMLVPSTAGPSGGPSPDSPREFEELVDALRFARLGKRGAFPRHAAHAHDRPAGRPRARPGDQVGIVKGAINKRSHRTRCARFLMAPHIMRGIPAAVGRITQQRPPCCRNGGQWRVRSRNEGDEKEEGNRKGEEKGSRSGKAGRVLTTSKREGSGSADTELNGQQDGSKNSGSPA